MTTQPEAKITKKIIDHLNTLPDTYAYKLFQGRFSGGNPDIDACSDGRAVKIEVKVPGNKPTPRQLAVMKRWEKARALVGWVTSVAEAEALLEHRGDLSWKNPQLSEP